MQTTLTLVPRSWSWSLGRLSKKKLSLLYKHKQVMLSSQNHLNHSHPCCKYHIFPELWRFLSQSLRSPSCLSTISIWFQIFYACFFVLGCTACILLTRFTKPSIFNFTILLHPIAIFCTRQESFNAVKAAIMCKLRDDRIPTSSRSSTHLACNWELFLAPQPPHED